MRQPLTLSPDAPELDTEAVKEAYKEFPVKEETVNDRDMIRALRLALEVTNIYLEGSLIITRNAEIRDTVSAQVERNKKLLGL